MRHGEARTGFLPSDKRTLRTAGAHAARERHTAESTRRLSGVDSSSKQTERASLQLLRQQQPARCAKRRGVRVSSTGSLNAARSLRRAAVAPPLRSTGRAPHFGGGGARRIARRSHEAPPREAGGPMAQPTPKSKGLDQPQILADTKAIAGTKLGDFNAPHRLWGYASTSPKGALLEQSVDNLDLQTANHTGTPTRTGNSKHFTDDQFEPVILARTGCKKLKPNAVPSIFLHRPVPRERKPPRRREKEAVYVTNLMLPAAASDKPGSSAETTPDPEPTCDTYTAASNNPGSSAEATAEPEPTCGSPTIDSHKPGSLAETTPDPEPTCGSLSELKSLLRRICVCVLTHPMLTAAVSDKTSDRMERNHQSEGPLAPSLEAALRNRISELELQLRVKEQQRLLANRKKNQITSEMNNLAYGLHEFLNTDQIQSLKKNTMRGTPWTEKTLRKSLHLRLACGKQGYKLMREIGQPLPAERTLQHHLQNYKFQPGLLHDLMPAFALKVGQMEPEERHATLMIDEIQLTPGLSYDASSGTVFGAPTMPLADGTLPDGCQATHAVVFMIGGVRTRWKHAGCGIPSHRQFLFGKGNEARCCRHNN
ncbi:hypothetical protein HPB49_007361 [Dermacentor silvarum]|uniref:Uncharacterized protein n=1 Tax=Dermacentor silvarum TaxID=543639 RepID=A0ACB8D3L3_DERSI|nr:hypothetical protein HPB49_007361 [Dermacentor silvarum]